MHRSATYGPRLVASPTGAIRAALVVAPGVSIERARPLPGEPNAIHSRALDEHTVFARTLRYFGCEVTQLSLASDDPYVSAVADSAVVFENGAVLMRPRAIGRLGEVDWLQGEFAKLDIPIAGQIEAPALLSGHDVLLVGASAFIAKSSRSNEAGRNAFAAIAKAHGFTPVEVDLAPQTFSLRSVAGAISSDTVVMAKELVDPAPFAEFSRILLERDDALGAGVLNLGERHVLADLRFVRSVAAMRKAGVTVEAIDLYDFARIGLTPSVLAIDLKRS